MYLTMESLCVYKYTVRDLKRLLKKNVNIHQCLLEKISKKVTKRHVIIIDRIMNAKVGVLKYARTK